MANFNTHLAVAAVGSGLCATVALAGHAAPNNYLLTLTLAGTIGGILPDIDLEKAMPARMLWSALGVVGGFIALFFFTGTYSIVELWAVWLAAFLLVRYGVFTIFSERTRHRGIFHSILAGAFFMALTADIFGRLLKEPPGLAWLTGLFVLIGYLIHLSLDEIYSVDVEGKKIKRSFGTALKLLDTHSWTASAAMGAALIVAVAFAPSPRDFEAIVNPPTFFAFLKDRLLPKGSWFGIKSPGTTASLESRKASGPEPAGLR